MNVPNGSQNSAWRVVPPAFKAATPVGAAMAIFLCEFSRTYFRKVVFPVPAFPVRNRCRLVWFTKETACMKALFCLSIVAAGMGSLRAEPQK